jgi:hypothetical protein
MASSLGTSVHLAFFSFAKHHTTEKQTWLVVQHQQTQHLHSSQHLHAVKSLIQTSLLYPASFESKSLLQKNYPETSAL